MLVLPVLIALGFLLLNGLVIAMAASSTERYEFGPNAVRREAAPAAAVANAVAAGAPAAGSAPARQEPEQRTLAVSIAAHPAGKLAGAADTAAGWWLLAPFPPGDGTDEVLGGPFPDRVEAEWAAVSGELDAVPVYGVLRPGEGVVRRPSPQDRDWLGELGDQLDRLGDDWTELVSDSDPLTSLVVEVTAVLVEAGVNLRDGIGTDPAGGVCLTPAPGAGGILVSWQPHDRMSMHQVRGAAVDAVVQRTLNSAVAELLSELGFAVEPFGANGCHLIRG